MPASGWLAVGAVLASLSGTVLPAPALLLAMGGVSLGAIVIRRDRRRRLGSLVTVLGAILILGRLIALPAPPAPLVVIPEGRGPWRATVVSVAPVRDGSQVATLRLDEPAGLLLAATLPRYPEIEPGLPITVDGAIRPPAAGPYADYLAKTGVAGTIQARRLEIRPASEPGVFERVRRAAAEALTRAIPEPEAGLAGGIVVGLRDRVDRSLSADFTTVGASHIVAISGWNIAIVAATVAALAGRLARRRRAILAAIAIVLYVAVAGGSASVVRAAAMAGVVLLARETGRAGRAAAALGWAATILLLIDPRLIRDAGFQLSSLATAGILAWATPLTDRLKCAAGGRLPGWLAECLAVSLAAQAATLPVVLLTFGRLAIVSPAVNLVIVPLVAPAMAACGVALVGGLLAMAGAPGAIATIVGLPAWFLLSLIVGTVQATARLPVASLTLEPPWNLVAATIAAGVPAAIIALRRRPPGGRARSRPRTPSAPAPPLERPMKARSRRPAHATRVVAIMLGGSVAGLLLVVAHRPDGATRITVLDVGQGDAILVEGSRGGRLLIDGGPYPDRLLIELDERLPPWDRRIDVLVLTHPHEDHVAGLALLLSRYRVGRVFEGGMRGPGPGYAAWAAVLERSGSLLRGTLATGDRLVVDDLQFRVLWPDRGRVPTQPPDAGRGINDVSIVLLGEVGGRRVLLTGDVEDDVDPLLASRGLPHVDFLKVAHHGSKTASTPAFLDLVRPAVAVVSAGAGNPYGHPARSTLDRLIATGARVYRTDTDGSVEVVISGGRMSVRAAGARAARATLRPETVPATPASPVFARFAFSCAVPSSG